MSVLRCAGSFRVSFHDTFTEPTIGSTASHWLNWSSATRGGSSLTRSGALQVVPPSVERDTKMSVPLEAVWSIQEQYRVPRLGPKLVSAPHAGYTRACRLACAGMTTSKAAWVGEMVCVGPKLWPPSAELDSTIALPSVSCQATLTVPSGLMNGSAPMSPFGPAAVLLANAGAEKLRPPSVEWLTSTPLEPDALPTKRSQAT